MSTVRMCDFTMTDGKVCGIIFSEREVGWSTAQLAVIDEDGHAHTESADFCPTHSPAAVKRSDRQYPRLNPAQDE